MSLQAMQAEVLILLDTITPRIDGFEISEKLKSTERTEKMPVIFMTALTDTKDQIRVFEVCGIDYISKPFNSGQVLASVASGVFQDSCRLKICNNLYLTSIIMSSLSHYRLNRNRKIMIVNIGLSEIN